MTEEIIRTVKVSKCYLFGITEVHALVDVDFTVKKGDFVAIMGPSGSGKSTLMHILGCLDRPSKGEYYLNGILVSRLSDHELASIRATKIGFVFQAFNLLPRTTALDNVTLPLLYGRQRPNKKLAEEALKRVGLGDRMYHKPGELSGGQQQRVAIARALVANPAIILADEPTGNLATRQSEEIMQLFQELNDDGITIVLVTHEAEIGAHAKRIVRFLDGRIFSDTSVEQRVFATDLLSQEGAII
ncbi:MAG: ABC transporter ATP-binding protein [bacterium]|jgi:putative ABC transport system ATP-binding protein|nr:ABC transporter ATP-binding protein [bacterium]